MNKKEKKCQCENQEQEFKEECNCCHDEVCNEKECNCQEQQCSYQNQDTDTSELLSKRINELNEALLRSQAELLNYKKRKDEETSRILKYAEKDIEFLKKILYFTRDCGYSLDGVKKLLQSNKQQYLDPKYELVVTLNEMKAMLLDMKSQLEN